MNIEIWLIAGLFLIADLYFVFLILSKKRKKFNEGDRNDFKKRWSHITSLEGGNAVMEADKLVHYYCKRLGLKGSMGDILKNNRNYFKNIDGLWFAHKQRNNFAHELGYKISDVQKKTVLREFYNACKDLGL